MQRIIRNREEGNRGKTEEIEERTEKLQRIKERSFPRERN